MSPAAREREPVTEDETVPAIVVAITRFLLRSTGGCRYAASLFTLILVLLYAALNRLDLMVNYAALATLLNVPSWLMLALLPCLALLLVGAIWNALVFGGVVNDERLIQARPIHGTTDRQGPLINLSIVSLVLTQGRALGKA